MSKTLHCVKVVEEYECDFFNYKQNEIEYIIDELGGDDVWKSEDETRIEIPTKDYLQMVEDIDATIINESGLIDHLPTEEDVEKVKGMFQALYDNADKRLGVVILVWY